MSTVTPATTEMIKVKVDEFCQLTPDLQGRLLNAIDPMRTYISEIELEKLRMQIGPRTMRIARRLMLGLIQRARDARDNPSVQFGRALLMRLENGNFYI